MAAAHRVEIAAPEGADAFVDILTPEALAFLGELHDRSLVESSNAGVPVRPVVAAALPDPGRDAVLTVGSGREDQGASAGASSGGGGRSSGATRRRGGRARGGSGDE